MIRARDGSKLPALARSVTGSRQALNGRGRPSRPMSATSSVRGRRYTQLLIRSAPSRSYRPHPLSRLVSLALVSRGRDTRSSSPRSRLPAPP